MSFKYLSNLFKVTDELSALAEVNGHEVIVSLVSDFDDFSGFVQLATLLVVLKELDLFHYLALFKVCRQNLVNSSFILSRNANEWTCRHIARAILQE